MGSRWLLGLAYFLFSSVMAVCAGTEPDFIRVAPDGFTFTDSHGARFLPMGAFYFDERHPGNDPLDYWDYFNPLHIREDFTLARQLGCNTLRLAFFMTVVRDPAGVEHAGTAADWEKCDTLVEAARENNLRLYVHVHIRGGFLQDTHDLPLFIEAFRQAAMRYRDELKGYKGQGHAFFIWQENNDQYFIETMRQADQFLSSLGWLQGEPTIEAFTKTLP